MTWKPAKRKWPWREYLTAEEAVEVKRIEAVTARAMKAVEGTARRYGLIRNRATQRAIHDDKRARRSREKEA